MVAFPWSLFSFPNSRQRKLLTAALWGLSMLKIQVIAILLERFTKMKTKVRKDLRPNPTGIYH